MEKQKFNSWISLVLYFLLDEENSNHVVKNTKPEISPSCSNTTSRSKKKSDASNKHNTRITFTKENMSDAHMVTRAVVKAF